MSTYKKHLKSMLLKTPGIKDRILYIDRCIEAYKKSGHYFPGHYYSAIPDLEDINSRKEKIFVNDAPADIDLNTEYQLKLLSELLPFYSEYPYNDPKLANKGLRYQKQDAFYRFSDSVFLYSILRRFSPKRIIEVGSGHSSAIMADVNDHFLSGSMQLTFIEPYPEERLMKILSEADKKKYKVIPKTVQSVDLSVFAELNENDVLFIDSTHVSKVGSDVNYLLFEVLPVLKPGVLIHIHDIFYPFEMPKHWILEWKWYWNEIYLLRAFLMNNKGYEIVNFNTYLHQIKNDWFQKEMPECLLGATDTGSIWLRKSA